MAVNKINQTPGSSHSHPPKGVEASWDLLFSAERVKTSAKDAPVFDQAPFSRKPEPLAERSITNVSGKKSPYKTATKDEKVAHHAFRNLAKFY